MPVPKIQPESISPSPLTGGPVTPDDDARLHAKYMARSLWISTAGILEFEDAQGNIRELPNVPVGWWSGPLIKKVRENTTAVISLVCY